MLQNLEAMERQKLVSQILSDAAVRRAVTRKSHYWFFSIFLSHYIQYEIALFQQEMFELTEGAEHRLIVVMAFRGSGKSTIMNLSYALWAILGVQQKKFVLIVSKTQSQAKNHLQNIRDELTRNELLKQDLGPFESDDTNWGLSSLVLPKMESRITAISREQSLRGIRFGHLRPDLIICDDLEDSTSVQLESERNAAYNWFTSEVLAAGDLRTNVIVLGNLLHESSLLMRLRADMLSQRNNLLFRAYPFADDNNQVMWPGKYDTENKIKDLISSILSEDLWKREYLLRYLPDKYMRTLRKVMEQMNKGEDPFAGPPAQMLGTYKISTPAMRLDLMDSYLHHKHPDPQIPGHVQEGLLPQENQSRHESEPTPAVEKPNQQDCSQQLGTDEGIYPS